MTDMTFDQIKEELLDIEASLDSFARDYEGVHDGLWDLSHRVSLVLGAIYTIHDTLKGIS